MGTGTTRLRSRAVASRSRSATSPGTASTPRPRWGASAARSQAFSQAIPAPGTLLTQLEVFAARFSDLEYLTLCHAVLDPATGAIDYASAGHPPILVLDPQGAPSFLEEGRSPPLPTRAARPTAHVVLRPGSRLVLYSDGLVERRGESPDAGLERLADWARELRPRALRRVRRRADPADGGGQRPRRRRRPPRRRPQRGGGSRVDCGGAMASTHEAHLHDPLEWDTPLFRTAIAQYDQAVPHADIDPGVAERLRYPERSIIVSCPVRIDDGRRVVFPGYRVQHSSALGPTKGGIRYDAEVTLGECAALAVWMTWKCALLRLPYGGAKGGVRCSPREMSNGELERLTRRYTSELLPFIGPQEDIPAPDMATNEQTMAWMMDTYSMQRGHAVPEIVTGKPISIGGSVFRHEATGAGVVMTIARACERLGWKLNEQRCVVQGFGNVGGIAALELVERGATVIAVSDVSGGVFDPAGLDIATMSAYAREHGSLEGWPTGRGSRTRSCSSSSATSSSSPRARTRSRPTTRRASAAGSSPRARTAPSRSRATRSCARARSPCCPTSSRTRAASPSPTSSGCRTSAASSGAATRSARARREAERRLRPRLGDLARARADAAHVGARGGDQGGVGAALEARGRSSRLGEPMSTVAVRDAMIAEPRSLPGTASAQEAGVVLSPPEVRAVYVVDATAASLASSRGRRSSRRSSPAASTRARRDRRYRRAAAYTLDADIPLDDAFRFLEENDAERVPVVEHGRLVGVLSRSVLGRRLAEDEEPDEHPEEATPATD